MVEPLDSSSVANQKEHFRTFIMIGNPGVGKSTLLNGLLRQVSFKAGVVMGDGLNTALLEFIDDDGNRFIDTPGLSDEDIRKKAVEELKVIIEKGGLFRIFFVVTLEAGLLRPVDKTLCQSILETVEEIGSSYSVIVNKVDQSFYEKMQNKEDCAAQQKIFNVDLPGTDKFYYCAHDPALVNASDKLPSLSDEFFKFINQESALMVSMKKEIDDVQAAQDLSRQIGELEREKRLLRLQIEDQDEEIQRISKEKDELNAERIEIQRKNFERLQKLAAAEEEKSRLKALEEKQVDLATEGRVKQAARSTVVYFTNRSQCNLVRSSFGLDHGIWDKNTPPEVIERLSAVVWASESHGFCTGTEGTAIYQCIGHNCRVKIHWNNPFIGANSYNESVSDTRYHKISRSGEAGDNAVIRISFI